ncbi:helix-turn-helix transcriptional regulator [Yersinia proxima]|uniref:helix-turn-helix transcriptional regulator n=1 Tax=Yersinia proxima TaxID=2890316 RepID=UPI000987C968|nr:LuxR C-terminal-related transcriptional regulator [Yersinia proxima]
MYNIIIFSGCGLIRFSLQKTVTDVMRKDIFSTNTINTFVCSEFDSFIDLLIQKNEVICIFDVDGISIKNQEKVFSLIRARFGESSLMVLWKGSELKFYYDFLQSNTQFLLSKSATTSEIEHNFYQLVKMKNKIKEGKKNSNVRHKTPSRRGLTHRQQQVLKFIMLGMNNKDIAEHLGISDKTVSAHRKSIYDKYNVKNEISLYYKVNESMLH